MPQGVRLMPHTSVDTLRQDAAGDRARRLVARARLNVCYGSDPVVRDSLRFSTGATCYLVEARPALPVTAASLLLCIFSVTRAPIPTPRANIACVNGLSTRARRVPDP